MGWVFSVSMGVADDIGDQFIERDVDIVDGFDSDLVLSTETFDGFAPGAGLR